MGERSKLKYLVSVGTKELYRRLCKKLCIHLYLLALLGYCQQLNIVQPIAPYYLEQLDVPLNNQPEK